MASAIVVAVLAAIGFTGASLLAVFTGRLTTTGRSYAIAVAAAILLVLSFGDLFPESLELAGDLAIPGFIGGFALLFLIESLTHAHTHHVPDEHVHEHAITPFVVGLAIHNFADGFAVGASAEQSSTAAALIGFGVLIHQIPVGLSLAAVLAAAHTSRDTVLRITILLGLAIPVAAALTVALPVREAATQGVLAAVAGGVLAYIATAHLLPEAQAEAPNRTTAVVFMLTLLVMTIGLLTVLGD